MSDGPELEPTELTAKVELNPEADPATAGIGKSKMPLPGLILIGLYMLVLAAVVTFGVAGGHYPPLFLILAAFFVTASFGLLRLFRWAWALTLSAVFLLASYNLWLFAYMKLAPGAIQGAMNLLLFLYLIRVEVRSQLR